MHEILVILGALLGCIISYFTINKFVFYTKSEIDQKLLDIKLEGEARFNELKAESDKRDELITAKIEKYHAEIKEDLSSTKDRIFEKLLEAERASNKARQDLYDRLTQNKEIFEDYNKNMLAAMSELKQDEKESDSKFIQILNDVKDELRNDYTNRYNEIITLMGTKVNVQDFDRLENKFDKVTETIIELKTIFQRNLDKK
jgi:hypothetical protein